ncbi:uncharacterized protein LOC127898956 [Citrus sinensis]|uniref:uncharacterized protein LOC112097724 n=1 Tax=Citrus clementina TaxID=85681 RepID=UPI000CED02C3|nr:uncharacterized protein LOC112097724 [Citrus x clementina]XP_052287597.1 uncharacterized protein LOC127898956 [Citrus sinensis]
MVKTAMTGATKSSSASTAENDDSNTTTPQPLLQQSEYNQDSSSLQLTVHKLNGKNYLEWAQCVKLVIDGKGKLGHLTGEVTKPAAGDPSLPTWRSANSMVIVWLINSMEARIGKPYLFLSTAKAVWDAIRDTYSDLENSSQIFELKTQLWQSKQGNREVTTYYNELLILWQKLDLCYDEQWDCSSDSVRYKKMLENDRVYVFLAGLNRDLDEVRGRILSRKPLPSIREVFSEVRREEARRNVMLNDVKATSEVESSESSALVSKAPEPDGDRRNSKKPWCDFCKRAWHTRETCWKLHGKPPHVKKKQGGDGRAFQATSDQEQSGSSESSPFTKDQLEHLYKLFQSSSFNSSTPSYSLAQKGFDLGEDDWQC